MDRHLENINTTNTQESNGDKEYNNDYQEFMNLANSVMKWIRKISE